MPNPNVNIYTNNTPESSIDLIADVLTFDDLWRAYPSSAIVHVDPKENKDIFDDHCTINVSESLYRNGIKLKAFQGDKCWSCPTPDENGRGIHAIRAQELADYLLMQPFAECPEANKLTGSSFREAISGKQGIIFFKDYWKRKHDGTGIRTGDHIDLWDGNELASIGAVITFIRGTFPDISERYFNMSDLTKSSEVLFWDMSG